MTNTNIIAFIWFIFTIIFLIFGLKHYDESKNKYPKFIPKKPKQLCDVSFYNPSAEISKFQIESFFKEFNNHINKLNTSNYKANKYASWGYFTSAIIAFLSFIMELELIK